MNSSNAASSIVSVNPRRAAQVDVSETDDGFMVYDHENDRVHVLNRSAKEVLELCSGERSAAEIAVALQGSYGLLAAPVREVETILVEMERNRLIEFRDTAPAAAP